MGIIIATEAQLQQYLAEQERLHDKSVGGVRDAVNQIEERHARLTGQTSEAPDLIAISNGAHLTDLSVGGIQHAIDVIESADPYGLRTSLPSTVEQLERLRDVSPSGIQGATALIRVVEYKEPLTDKSVRGHVRAAEVTASTPPIAYEIEGKAPKKARPVEQPVQQAVAQETPAQQSLGDTIVNGILGAIARARAAIRDFLA